MTPRTRASTATAKRVGAELRRAREELGLSQAAVAARLGVSPAYVSMLESGAKNLTLGQLARLASAMGTRLQITFPAVEREQVSVAGRGGRSR